MIPQGLFWNEAPVPSDDIVRELVGTVFHVGNHETIAIGTGFIIGHTADAAVICTAGHVVAAVANKLQPNFQVQSLRTPVDFRSPRPEFNSIGLNFLLERRGKPIALKTRWCLWDDNTDIGFMITDPIPADGILPAHFMRFESTTPQVGETVGVFGFSELDYSNDVLGLPRKFRLMRRAVVRIGTITAIHENGTPLVKAPSLQTTVPIDSGMSGGLVARFTSGAEIRALAVASNAPTLQSTTDRSVDGQSTCSLLSPYVIASTDGKISFELPFDISGFGRAKVNDS
jgi:Trypsin-like peptidase domain